MRDQDTSPPTGTGVAAEPAELANTVWWHVYPLGFGGAQIRPDASHGSTTTPAIGNGEVGATEGPAMGLRRLIAWLDHARDLGCQGLLLGPIFTAATHGYDTLDYFTIDPRLGTLDDFEDLLAACHARGMRVLLDGVFSHVASDHPWLQSDLASGDQGRDMFDIDWHHSGGPRPRVWEGHGSLARLNHGSAAARELVIDVMCYWLAKGIDGWRLDAAYSVPEDFWASVLPAVRQRFPNAYFLGEMIHGDYAGFVKRSGVDSVTQYELWKAIWSSLNDANFFELDWALQRHNEFAAGFTPQTFVGNHDVTRIASQVGRSGAVLAAVVLATVAGTPSIYYGDEQGLTGVKEDRLGGDDAVRPAFPPTPAGIHHDGARFDLDMFAKYQSLLALRRANPWLTHAITTPLSLECQHYRYRTNARDGSAWLDVELDATAGADHMRAAIRNQHGQIVWESQ